MEQVRIDRYVVETLMRDLVGHDRTPSAFVVYLFLWTRTFGAKAKSVRISHKAIADETGLSKSAVQAALSHLRRRRLLKTSRESITAIPEHVLARPWRK